MRNLVQECIYNMPKKKKKKYFYTEKNTEKWKGQTSKTVHEIFHIFKDMYQQTKKVTKCPAQWLKTDPQDSSL